MEGNCSITGGYFHVMTVRWWPLW